MAGQKVNAKIYGMETSVNAWGSESRAKCVFERALRPICASEACVCRAESAHRRVRRRVAAADEEAECVVGISGHTLHAQSRQRVVVRHTEGHPSAAQQHEAEKVRRVALSDVGRYTGWTCSVRCVMKIRQNKCFKNIVEIRLDRKWLVMSSKYFLLL